MNNDLQIPSNNNVLVNSTPTTLTQVGDKNTQVAHADNIHVINIIVPNTSNSTNNMNTNIALSNEYYNLFVVGSETFDSGNFIVPKERALTESISAETATLFSSLNDYAISQIKTFPSLFASENHQYGRTDINHQAFFGLVTDIRIQENGIKIYFHKLSPIAQQRMNEIASSLAIRSASSLNELNRTHWAIKRINLIEELRTAGISVLAPTLII